MACDAMLNFAAMLTVCMPLEVPPALLGGHYRHRVSLVPSGGLPACFVIVPACLVITCYDLVVEATYRRVAHYRVSWPAACTPGEPALQNMALTLVFTLLEM